MVYKTMNAFVIIICKHVSKKEGKKKRERQRDRKINRRDKTLFYAITSTHSKKNGSNKPKASPKKKKKKQLE
jgi:hypothetical protein